MPSFRHVVAALALTFAIGCAEPPPPVAAVSLGVDRISVPLGGPLEVSLRFETAPDLVPLTEDYRVFVHFLSSDRELLWTEDHDPAVPTSLWKPGQTIEYTRSVTIPTYPYVGAVTLAVGLYSPESGIRLTLAGEDLGQTAYGVATIQIEPQHESSFLVYEEGWHPAEFDPTGQSNWRWTSGRAVIAFRNPHGDVRLILEVDGRPDLFAEPQRLSLVIDDLTVRELVVDTNGRVDFDETVSAADLGENDIVRLELQVDQTFVPAELDSESRDTRELGVRIFVAYVEPV